MSITDELREYFGKSEGMFTDHVLAIADRIDAEHQKAMSRAGQLLDDAEKERDYNYANWQDCKQRVLQGNITFGELNAEIERLKDELARCVELPKDADGEPIRVGDELDYLEALHPDVPAKFKVQDMFYYGNGKWHLRAYPATYEPEKCRHYHAPTVEDVLTKFGIDWEYESDCEDRVALLKEYAAKLRLAEEDA